MAFGFEQHDSVNIFGFNSPEWFMAQCGAMFAGGRCAGIYPNDNADQVNAGKSPIFLPKIHQDIIHV